MTTKNLQDDGGRGLAVHYKSISGSAGIMTNLPDQKDALNGYRLDLP
ncbi:hypothetical protein [Spirosoma jeollabukense]